MADELSMEISVAATVIKIGGASLTQIISDLTERLSNLEAQVKSNYAQLDDKKADKFVMDAELAKKADKQFVDEALCNKADTESVDTELSKLASKEYVDAGLTSKAAQMYVDAELAKKADKLFVDSELASKADKRFVNEALGKKADTNNVDEGLKAKAAQTYVDAELAKKADKDVISNELKRKADSEHVDAEFAKRMHTEHALAELAKKADKSQVDARAAYVDAELEKKTGKDFLEAQIAGLSKEARAVTKDIEFAMKEEIAFEASSANLLPAAKKIINKVAAVLKKHEEMKICIEGHTGCKCAIDPKSSPPGSSPLRKNSSSQFGCKAVELSNNRAASVIEALKQAGCKNPMVSKGHGCVYRVGMAVKIFPAKGQ